MHEHLAQDFCLRKGVVNVAIDSYMRGSFVYIRVSERKKRKKIKKKLTLAWERYHKYE